MPASRSRKSKKRTSAKTKPDRRRLILRAAIDVFARQGYHGTRMSDVAKEAGVAYGLVYHYFQSKESLLEAVFELSWSGFAARIREASRTRGTVRERVHALLSVGFEAYRVDPKGVRVVLLEIARSPESSRLNRQSAFGEMTQIAASVFQEALARGELKEAADPLLCSAMLFGALESLLTTFVFGLVSSENPEALEHAKQQLMNVFFTGLLRQEGSETSSAGVSPRPLE